MLGVPFDPTVADFVIDLAWENGLMLLYETMVRLDYRAEQGEWNRLPTTEQGDRGDTRHVARMRKGLSDWALLPDKFGWNW